MSLLRKLLLIISVLMVSLLLGNLVISILHARTYFSDQMAALAQDTATSLGLTISHAAQQKDLPQIQSMINVIFDRGYYRKIVYLDLNGKVVIERSREIVVEGVPQWFIKRIPIAQQTGASEVVSGWYRLGELTVTAHPGYAYRDLWRVFNSQVRMFLFTAVLCYGLAGIGLKYLLRPLRRVEEQAEAICRKEFPVQDNLPSTPELRRMVLAMNKMVRKIQEMFQQQLDLTDALRRDSSIDQLTGLVNRREFDLFMTAWLGSDEGGGAGLLILLQLHDLQQINDDQGREVTDGLLRDISEILKTLSRSSPNSIVSRRGGSDFCIFIPAILPDEIDGLLSDLKSDIHRLEKVVLLDQLEVHIAAAYTKSVVSISKMLSAADTAMHLVKSQDDEGSKVYFLDSHDQHVRPASEWSSYLSEIIDQHNIVLHFQALFDRAGRTVLNYEVLCRIGDGNELVNAGIFWPLVERFGLARQLDQEVIIKTLDVLKTEPKVTLSVNISPLSIVNDQFTSWLTARLQEVTASSNDVAILQRLIFELPEKVLHSTAVEFTDFVARVKAFKVKVGLDRFGLTPSAMGRLQSLDLAYVKIDRRFITGIESNRENQFYVKNLIQIAKSCDVTIIAEGIETEHEWQMLKFLGIDGGQGFLLATPGAKFNKT